MEKIDFNRITVGMFKIDEEHYVEINGIDFDGKKTKTYEAWLIHMQEKDAPCKAVKSLYAISEKGESYDEFVQRTENMLTVYNVTDAALDAAHNMITSFLDRKHEDYDIEEETEGEEEVNRFNITFHKEPGEADANKSISDNDNKSLVELMADAYDICAASEEHGHERVFMYHAGMAEAYTNVIEKTIGTVPNVTDDSGTVSRFRNLAIELMYSELEG